MSGKSVNVHGLNVYLRPEFVRVKKCLRQLRSALDEAAKRQGGQGDLIVTISNDAASGVGYSVKDYASGAESTPAIAETPLEAATALQIYGDAIAEIENQ